MQLNIFEYCCLGFYSTKLLHVESIKLFGLRDGLEGEFGLMTSYTSSVNIILPSLNGLKMRQISVQSVSSTWNP